MKGYTQFTRLHRRGSSLLTWARADPSELTRGNCAVAVDRKEATGLTPAISGVVMSSCRCRLERPGLGVHEQLTDTITELRALVNWTPSAC